MRTSQTLTRDLLIMVTGILVVVLSHIPSMLSFPAIAETLQTIGIGMAGYAPVQFIINFRNFRRLRNTKKSIRRLFESAVTIYEQKETLPAFIAADVEGCITPSNRAEIDLIKLQRLRSYCEFTKSHREYPPLVIYTGRSQGYVELLAQSLGMLDSPLDLPFVIENGCALYRPGSKQTIPLINSEQLKAVRKVQLIINAAMPNNLFEPKTYMVTINPTQTQSVDELRESITVLLKDNDLLGSLAVTNTASAVDITPKGISKLSGLKENLKYYPDDRMQQYLDAIVGVGDHISDLPVLKNIGRAYCPAENVHIEVRNFVESKFGKDHVIDSPDIEFVIRVIELECGLRVA